MAHINVGIHPKISRVCSRRPSQAVIGQLELYCERVALVMTFHRNHQRFMPRVDLYGVKDLRNLFMVDILLQDVLVP